MFRNWALELSTLIPPPAPAAEFCAIVELVIVLVGAPAGTSSTPPPSLVGAELPTTSVRSIVRTAP